MNNNLNKPEVYANELKRANGLDKAIKIANSLRTNTHPSQHSYVPNGPVFNHTGRHNKNDLNTNHLTYLHNWWTQVYHILKKMERK